uniref:Uncharacterized protein n=1 Tax=Quercus lobata TaxID=97700 RepID=A0A7N2KQ61_QUELO
MFPTPSFYDFPIVSSHIDEETRRWKADLIRTLFLPFEADTILRIPLSYNLPDDNIVWVGNRRDVGTSHDLEVLFTTAWSIWGIIVAPRGKLLLATYSVGVTEALVVEEGIILALEFHLPQKMIKSNSITVVQAVNTSSFIREMGTIIQGVFTMLTSFSSWRV